MKKFTLANTYKVLRDGTVEIAFRPSDELIEDYIVSYKIYNTLAEGIADIDNSLIELIPLMFADFQQLESVPVEIRNQFEL
jgi:hypothetical protein